ncbi:CYTH domain-containing protein [Sulfuriflexus mobilis]|uniref:CYTH domain-containing protein n=1 Tax=Sulfuriflexus mobilis TaxID=1811807 RepID=UPI000F82AFF6|nr:CYTH domain-containing protein [Sulfuriflexus mobilis]
MGIEIERKFLLRNDDWRAAADAGTRMRQGYFAGPQRASIRVRIEGESANLNIKSAELGIRRLEFEYPVPLVEAEQMLDGLCEGPLVEKTRYRLVYAGFTWEVDVFAGDNAGLVVAEIELPTEDSAFEKPDWLGEEVSADPRYYNVSLVTHPYCDW